MTNAECMQLIRYLDHVLPATNETREAIVDIATGRHRDIDTTLEALDAPVPYHLPPAPKSKAVRVAIARCKRLLAVTS